MRGTPPNVTDLTEIEIRPGGGPAVVPYREGPVDPLARAGTREMADNG
jgi:hypothetical protein